MGPTIKTSINASKSEEFRVFGENILRLMKKEGRKHLGFQIRSSN